MPNNWEDEEQDYEEEIVEEEVNDEELGVFEVDYEGSSAAYSNGYESFEYEEQEVDDDEKTRLACSKCHSMPPTSQLFQPAHRQCLPIASVLPLLHISKDEARCH